MWKSSMGPEPAPPPSLARGSPPPPSDAVYVINPVGRIWLWQPRPGVVISRAEGRFTPSMTMAVLAFLERVEPKPLLVFHDWYAVTGYDPGARTLFTNWMRRNPGAGEYHVAIGSKMVAMGVSVVSLATRIPVTAHTPRSLSERLARALRPG